MKVPLAHVEAGLRSWNRAMPEEINRVAADHVSDLLFAPTRAAVGNLRREGIAADRIVRTGDVMYDAALYYADQAARARRLPVEHGLDRGGYVLATVHRAENTDDPARLSAIFDALGRLARAVDVVVPLHPRTRRALARLGWRPAGRLRLIEPVGYLGMVRLEKHARLIATDSGGVQKEAYFYGVPCATLRAETEWVELVRAGWNTLVPPTSGARVFRELGALLAAPRPRRRNARLYGDGRAADVIVRWLARAS
jgi:UDP-GlcNAc3NAcA epimerase